MTPGDTARLLALVQAYDNRHVDELAISAWHAIVAPLDFNDACQIIREHYTRSRDWIMPTDVVTGVTRTRHDRLARTEEPLPAADPDDPTAWVQQLRRQRQSIADGRQPQQQLEAAPMPQGYREQVLATIPPALAKPPAPGDPRRLGSCLDPLNAKLAEVAERHATEQATGSPS